MTTILINGCINGCLRDSNAVGSIIKLFEAFDGTHEFFKEDELIVQLAEDLKFLPDNHERNGDKMTEFTFETKDRMHKYETYEWDNTWIDHPNDDIKRILYVGDSISCGIRPFATKIADGKAVFDLFGTSRAVDNPFFKDALAFFASQEGRRDAVLFNNGLHGFHLDDATDFKEYYEDMLKFMLEQFKETPIVIVLSTFIAKKDVERVMARNKSVCELAEKYHLPVIDLYSVSQNAKDFLTDDGVHLTGEGYQILAEELVKTLNAIL